MAYYVYILQSLHTQKFYCGQTDSVEARLERHNMGLVQSTKHGIPWILKKYVALQSRAEAMKLEKWIKGRGIGRWLSENN